MKYLNYEARQFEVTKEAFRERYVTLLNYMQKVFLAKGVTRDVNSPIHHRQSPQSMLALAQAKGRRVERLLETEQYPAVIEECVDIANYVLFIAALYKMLEAE